MILIKLSEDHYVLTDDSEITTGDIVAEKLLTGKYELFTIHTLNDIDRSSQKKITYSTQPESLGMGWMQSVQPLLLSEVKELLGVVNVEKKAQIEWGNVHRTGVLGYIDGYNQALEDNKEKQFTIEDVVKAFTQGKYEGIKMSTVESEDYIQSLQAKSEWEVEIVNNKLKLKS